MFRKNLGIDIGATQISICSVDDGLLLKEPAVAAVDVDSEEVVEAGQNAMRVVSESPDRYRLCWPLWDPLLKCAEILSKMFQIFIYRAIGKTALRPQVMISIPCDLTESEANAIEDAALAARVSQAHLLEAPLCAALGAGVDFSAPSAHFLLHVGASRTEAAVLFMGEMVVHTTIPFAGNQFDSAIIRYMRNKKGLYIGKRTAEQIKIRLATLKDEEERTLDVKGRCMKTQEPRVERLSSKEMLGALYDPLGKIVDAVIEMLRKVDDDMRADIVKEGILLTGGGIVKGMEWFFEQLFRVRVRRAPNADVAAVEGAALALARLRE